MKNYVLVQNNIVVNKIVWDGETQWECPENMQYYEYNGECDIGWGWDGTQPINPNPQLPQIVVDDTKKFVVTTISIDEFNIYRSFASEAGTENIAHRIADDNFRVSIMTSGSRKLEVADGSQLPIIFNVGDFNNDPHDIRSINKQYKNTTLEPNTEMYCVWRKDKKPFDYTRFNLQPNETLELPKFKRAFFGSGKTLFGTGPHVIRADLQDRSINIIESAFGIVF